MRQTAAGARATGFGRRSIRASAAVVGLALAGTGGVAGLAPAVASAADPPSAHLLQVSVSVDRSSVVAARPGSSTPPPTLTYTIELRSSPTEHDPPVRGVEVIDQLPPGVTPVSQDSASPVTIDGRAVRWSLGDVGFFVWRAHLVVSVDPTNDDGTLTDRAGATSTDGGRVDAEPVDTAVTAETPSTAPPPTQSPPTQSPPTAPTLGASRSQPPATSRVMGVDISRSAPAAPALVGGAGAATSSADATARQLARTGVDGRALALVGLLALALGVVAVAFGRPALY